MGKVRDPIDDATAAWLTSQRMTFVATARRGVDAAAEVGA